ncbi:MAG: geranylgeranyl reductase family protein [Candidatus Odinarchaeia archaeon]
MKTGKTITVIGAGPTGSLLSSKLAENNFNIITIEEHRRVGQPDHCAGLVSSKIKKIYKIKQKMLLNKIKGAIVRFGEDSFRLYRKKDEAYVLNRMLFDEYQADYALKKGAEIILGAKITHIKKTNTGFKIYTRPTLKIEKSEIVVNAGGVKGLLKFNNSEPYSGLRPALQYEVTKIQNIEKDFVELYFNSHLTPGFFSWIIPLDEETARVGLASSKIGLKTRLDYFIKKLKFNKERFKKSKILKIKPGIVLTGGPVKKLTENNLINIGDAGGIVKPTTGGGLITGGYSALIAFKSITMYYKNEFEKINYLDEYQRMLNNQLGFEFKIMKFTRMILDNLNNKQLNQLFSEIKNTQILENLMKYGDMDFQSKSLISIFKTKNIYKIIPIIGFGLIRSYMFS